MNRDHQRICPRCGTSPLADDERCWNCNYPLELAGGATAAVAFARVGDSTPPAEPPDENWFQRQARLAARDVQLLPPWLRSHPPAVSGEGERLMEQAAAYRAIALDALACWQGEDEHSDDNQRRNRSARSRATLRHRICAVDDTVRASTPTPGAPR